MRVAIFTDYDFDTPNDVTATLRALLRHAPNGIRPFICTASEFSDAGSDYFAPRAFPARGPMVGDLSLQVPRLWAYVHHVRRESIDAIHLATPGPLGVTARYVAWHTGLPLLGSIPGDVVSAQATSRSFTATASRRYRRWLYGGCERVLVRSAGARDRLVSNGIRPANVAIWPAGVDPEFYTPVKRSPAVRERWRVSERRPAIMYVGGIARESGLDLLRPIQSALHRRRIEHRLVLVGDGPYRRALQEELPDAIFTGPLRPADAAVAIASADLLLFPGETTPAPAVLEAQASGVPVIVAGHGTAYEYIRDGETGIACDRLEIDRLADRAARLFREPARHHEMSVAARAHALSFRWQDTLDPVYRSYVEMSRLGRRPAGDGAPAASTTSDAMM